MALRFPEAAKYCSRIYEYHLSFQTILGSRCHDWKSRQSRMPLCNEGKTAEAADDTKDVVVGREHLNRAVIRVGDTVLR